MIKKRKIQLNRLTGFKCYQLKDYVVTHQDSFLHKEDAAEKATLTLGFPVKVSNIEAAMRLAKQFGTVVRLPYRPRTKAAKPAKPAKAYTPKDNISYIAFELAELRREFGLAIPPALASLANQKTGITA